jgi:hypothetical protein
MQVEVGTLMKYLSLILDNHWAFGAHFERLVPSVEDTANALGSLLPRIGGSGAGGCSGCRLRSGKGCEASIQKGSIDEDGAEAMDAP